MVKGLPTEWGLCSRTVALDDQLSALACWKETIAVGLNFGAIVTLDGTTGIQIAILSGHTGYVRSLAFSSGGALLVSGSDDETIKLWDVQTGGVVKTFQAHTEWVWSTSISADCTMIASGSDNEIFLWDIQAEECCCVIKQRNWVHHVRFSPTDPDCLMSVSGNKVRQWDRNGHQIAPTYYGSNVAFSPDGTQFVLCQGENIVVQQTDSGEIVAKFRMANSKADHCCFSPDGRLIAVALYSTVYVWDTTSSAPHPIETFVGPTDHITSLEFFSPSSLISSSGDQAVKFWKIGTLAKHLVATDTGSTLDTPAGIKFMTLQASDGIVISQDSDGVVRMWDLSTGQCKASSKTPAKDPYWSDAQLVNGRLTAVWCKDGKFHIWGVGDVKPQIIDADLSGVRDIRISGDGSKVFCLRYESVQAWSILTGEVVSKVELESSSPQRTLSVDGSRVWVHSPVSEAQGWDFGIPGSPPVPLPNSDLPNPSSTKLWDRYNSRLKDAATGKVFFQLPRRFAAPSHSQWDGQYLVAGYKSGEVLILDFSHLHF